MKLTGFLLALFFFQAFTDGGWHSQFRIDVLLRVKCGEFMSTSVILPPADS
jgi:hypothetical protein